jgi:four helix bundle protein
MAISKFEDIIGWQKARVLAQDIYSVTAKDRFTKDFGLRDQIQRASVSVMANVAEGFERRNAAEFARFLTIALGSCAEVQSHLYIAKDIGYLSETEFEKLYAQAKEISKILSVLKQTIQAQKNTKP